MSTDDICFMTATELARRIRAKELSAREVMEAHLTQIERVNPKVKSKIAIQKSKDFTPPAAGDNSNSQYAALGMRA